MAKNKMKSYIPSAVADKEWQARCDADTLAQAKEIENDPQRMSKATKCAGDMAEKKMEEAKALKSVAKKGKKHKI